MTDKDKIIEYSADAEDIRENLDFVRSRFEDDGLQVPEGLSEDAVRRMLTEEPVGAPAKSNPSAASSKDAPARRRRLRIGIAAAACAVLAIGLIPLLHSVLPGSGAPGSSLIADDSGLVSFSSYDELDHEMKNLLSAREQSGYSLDGGYALAINEDAELADSDSMAADAPMAESKGSSEPSHSDTYNQVEGIDEADIVKTD